MRLALCVVVFGVLSVPAYGQAIVAANSFSISGGTYQDAVLPGDTFQVPFTVTNNDTGAAADLASVRFVYNNVTAAPGADFANVGAATFRYFAVLDSGGNVLGVTAGGTGPGSVITILTPGVQQIDTSGSVLFYLVLCTADTASQTVFNLTINTAAGGGVSVTGPAMTAHNITSMNLQVVRPVVFVRTGTPGGSFFVVGANSGPFKLVDFNVLSRTSSTITFDAHNITCTNVRGFTPGAKDFGNTTPGAYTGDIEKFVTTAGGITHNFNRQGTPTALHLRQPQWNTESQAYRIKVAIDTATTVAAGGTTQFDFFFHTNAYISDLPAPGGFVPGDAFFMSYDSMSLTISPTGSGFLKNNGLMRTNYGGFLPFCSLGLRVEANNIVAHPHLDVTNSAYADESDLDFIAYRPLFNFTLLGGPGNTQGLRSVKLNIHHAPDVDLNSETSPLRRIDQTENSGIQIRSTTDGTYSMSDPLYPLDVSQTLITRTSPTTTTVDLVISGYMPLSTDQSVQIYGTSLDYPRVWIGVEPSVNARFGDSMTFEIPPGGIKFLSGLSMFETSLQSRCAGSDTWVEGVLNVDTLSYVFPLVDTARLTFGMPIIFRDLTASGQTMPPSSQPTVVTGFNIQDSRTGALLTGMVFFVLDAVSLGGGPISDQDFASFAFDSTSGWALYRDNDSHPSNTNGVFDPGIDSFIQFETISAARTRYVPIGNAYPASTLSPYGAVSQPLMVALFFDTTNLSGRMFANDSPVVPPNDLNAFGGDDFFLVCRTSPTITPGDKFRVVVGDINGSVINVYSGGITFETSAPLFSAHDRVFSLSTIERSDHRFYTDADGNIVRTLLGNLDPVNDSTYGSARSADGIRSEVISITGGIAVNVTNLIVGPKTVFRGNELALIGINALDTGGGIAIVSLLVDVIDSGVTLGDFDTRSDLAAFGSALIAKGAGLAIFQDNGDSTGIYDSKDSVISGIWSIDTTFGSTTRFKFAFSPAIDMADTDIGTLAGNDLFVVATMGDSLLYKDDFAFRIPSSAFEFAPPGVVSQPPPVTTGLLTAGMPVKLLNLPDSGVLPNNGDPIAVIGIMAADTTFVGGDSVLLDKIRIRLDDPTAPGGFPSAILNPLVSDSTSGISIWIDGNGNRTFDSSVLLDTPIPVSSYTYQSANVLDIDLVNANGPVPDVDTNGLRSDTAAVFFIVLRASSFGLDHQVQVTIQAVSSPADPWIKFTAPTDPGLSLTPNALTIAPASVSGVFSPSVFSPNGDGITDTASVTFTIVSGNPDSRWTLTAAKVSSAQGGTLATGAFDTTVLIAKTGVAGNPVTVAWPSAFNGGGAFQLSFTYDRAGVSKNFQFSDTLLVDLFCTAPILISTLPTIVTTGNTVAVSIAADSDRSSVDKFALTAGESVATYYIYRQDGTVATLLATGSLSNFVASNVSVNLQGGNNILLANLRDTYGNWSDTTTLGTVQLAVGTNQAIVQDLLTDASKLWLGKSESTAVFGFNLTQDFPNEFVNAFTLQLFDSGGFAYGQNISDVPVTGTYPDTGGFLLYRDNTAAGIKGTWDTQDALVPINPPQRNTTFTSGDTVRIVPQSPLPVPTDDTSATTQGFDYFLVVYGAGGRFFRDSFVLSMPANTAFEFASASPTRSNLTATVRTPPILTRIPRTFVDRTSAHDSIPIGSNMTEVLGINVSDSTRNTDGLAALSSITLDFVVAAGDTFNPTVLAYAVYRDSGSANVGSFSIFTDSEVTSVTSFLSSTKVKLTLSGANSDIPNSDAGNDSGADFWVTVRPSVISLSQSNKFTVSILPGNVVTTGDSPGGPGIGGSTKITIPAGGLSTSISPNPFSPNGDGFYDTAGYAISFADTRGFRLVLNRVTNGDTYYNLLRYGKDTTFVFASSDTTGWTTDEYRITITDTVTNAPSTEATLLVADIKALTPTLATAPATTTSGTSLSVTIRVSEIVENSVQRATSKSERDSFALVFTISSATSGDTYDTAFGALTASSVDVTKTIPLFSGANTIRVTLIDKVGNKDSSLTFSVNSAAAITGNIGFEGNSPLFRYTPSNTTFTFSFPTTVSGGTMEFYNIAGDRLRLITLPAGVSTIDWNAANDAGQTLRNGVYIIKFKVPLSDGRTIEESRTIFLLK